jgi:hypothetical protein
MEVFNDSEVQLLKKLGKKAFRLGCIMVGAAAGRCVGLEIGELIGHSLFSHGIVNEVGERLIEFSSEAGGGWAGGKIGAQAHDDIIDIIASVNQLIKEGKLEELSDFIADIMVTNPSAGEHLVAAFQAASQKAELRMATLQRGITL